MTDGLVEALKLAGLPTQAARETGFNPSTGIYLDLDQFRVAVATDRDAVLRVLLEARLDDPKVAEKMWRRRQDECRYPTPADLLSILTPEAS